MAFKINFDDEHGDNPVTSLQKLRALGLDPAVIATCAPPNEKMGVRGCTQWANCPFAFKGLGPRWVGMQRIYKTGHRKDRIKACFAFVRQRERHLDQEDVWRVIAHQGDPFVWRVTEATRVDEKGNKSGYREVLKQDMIPTWPEPEEHPALRQLMYAAEAFKDMRDDQHEMLQAEALANMTGEEPAFWMKPGGHRGAEVQFQGRADGEADSGGGADERSSEPAGPGKRGR